MGPLAPLLLEPDCETLAAWLSDTPPPAGPIVLATGVRGMPCLTVHDPAAFWAEARRALADGLRGQAGQGVLWLLRRLKEVLSK